jgi:hypothetical protein
VGYCGLADGIDGEEAEGEFLGSEMSVGGDSQSGAGSDMGLSGSPLRRQAFNLDVALQMLEDASNSENESSTLSGISGIQGFLDDRDRGAAHLIFLVELQIYFILFYLILFDFILFYFILK